MKTAEINTPWHIAGIGAMGGLLASRFCHGGHPVHLLLKNESQLRTYQQSQLTVVSDTHRLTCAPPAINIEQIAHEPIRYLLCCVKAYDTTALLMRLQPHLNEQSIIILLHNGLGVLEEIKTQLPQLRIISCISTVGAYLERPYVVKAFLDGTLYLGELIGAFSTNEINTICTTFQNAQLPYQWEKNIHAMMWEKFAQNCSVNLLTALFNCKNGALLTEIEPLKKMTNEVATVVNAYGIQMTAADLFHKVTQLINRVADNYSSMYKDVQHSRPTELHYLNQHLIHLAKKKNIATPFNVELLKQFYGKFSFL